MSEGRFNLNWPWNWLSGLRSGRPFAVAESIQPTVDVTRHTSSIYGYREQFVMAAGTNIVVLPGHARTSSVAALPVINGNGARRWLQLGWEIDNAPGAGNNLLWAYGAIGANIVMLVLEGATTPWPAGRMLPVLGGASYSGVQTATYGLRGSLYVPDPNFLFFSFSAGAGGQVITIYGTYLDAETRDEPLPAMFD